MDNETIKGGVKPRLHVDVTLAGHFGLRPALVILERLRLHASPIESPTRETGRGAVLTVAPPVNHF